MPTPVYRALVKPRIFDIGGWLDTWFAKYGELLNVAVLSRYFGKQAPFRGIRVGVEIEPAPIGQGFVAIHTSNPSFDVMVPISDLIAKQFDHQDLLLAVMSLLPLDQFFDRQIEVHIESPIPGGASMGTSAAVATGCLWAFSQALEVRGQRPFTAEQVARLAWLAETDVQRNQSGIQDQLASAYSGDEDATHYITVADFPHYAIESVELSPETIWALQDGTITVFVGKHSSSDTHRMVIDEMENEGSESPRLQRFRGLARSARRALEAGALFDFGQVLRMNTEAQRGLHPDLVGPHHQRVLDLAETLPNFLGGKVNGAGGEGGSVSLLFSRRADAERFYQEAKRQFRDRPYLYFEHQLAA